MGRVHINPALDDYRVTKLAEQGAVRLIEGKNQFNAPGMSLLKQGRQDVLNRITVIRVLSSYQMLMLLQETTSTPERQPVNQEE